MRVGRLYLVAGVAAIVLYFALPWNGLAQTIVYDAIGASAAAAVFAGARIFRPSSRLPWYLFAAGLLAFAVGDVIFNLYTFVWHREPPVPSGADVFYLAGYPFLTAGLVLLVRRLRSEERRGGGIDAAMLIVAFALCQWVFIMKDLVHSGSGAGRVVALAYPAMDVVLLAALAFFALTPVWRTASYRYLALSVVLLIFADELYGLAPDKYANASWLDAAWLLSYVFWGVAALDPSMRRLSEPAPSAGPSATTSRLALLAGALATAPAVLLVQAATGSPVDAVAIALGAAALCSLVLLRLTRAQRLLTEQNERLREADRLKDEFLALISHELRTPLTSIRGYVELALEDELDEDVHGFLEVVSRNSERLLALVDDLLFVARLQTCGLALEPCEIDLADIVRGGVRSMEPGAAAKGIALECSCDSLLPAVNADRGRVLQVLDSLVSNAVKFTPEGGTVNVSLSGEEDRVVLEVADSGIGISPQDQLRLFERFFRAENAVEQQVPGTGLGLFISRVIAEAHGGTLAVRSELGRGTTFRLELPLRVVPVAEAAHGLDRDGVRALRVELAP